MAFLKTFVLGVFIMSVVFAHAAGAFASERLRFDTPLNSRNTLLLKNAKDILKTDPAGLSVAHADLNQDGVDELIVRARTCGSPANPCNYTVLAETDEKLVSLGTIPARDLTLDNRSTAGVRNILAYNDAVNDFKYALYIWEPRQSRYILEP